MLLEAGGIDGSWGNGGIAGAERRKGVGGAMGMQRSMGSSFIGVHGSGSSAGGLVEVVMGQCLYLLKAAGSFAESKRGKEWRLEE